MPFNYTSTPRQGHENWSTHKVLVGVLTGPASYATGGEAFAASDVGWGSFDLVLPGIATDGTNTRVVAYNRTTGKLQWFLPDTDAEVTAAVNLSTFTCYMLVAGHG